MRDGLVGPDNQDMELREVMLERWESRVPPEEQSGLAPTDED